MNCKKCGSPFESNRSNKIYCSKKCQNNGSRKSRTVEYKERNSNHNSIAATLAENFRKTISSHQNIYIAKLLTRALNGERKIKNVLTDPKLLGDSRNPKNIAFIVNDLCKKSLGQSSIRVIREGNTQLVDKLKTLPVPSHSCPRLKPDHWDYRNLLDKPLFSYSNNTTSRTPY